MSTRFYLRNLASTLGGAGQLALTQRGIQPGGGTVISTTTATAGGTNIQLTATAGGQALVWFTEPLTSPITLAANSIVVSLYGSESATNVNAAFAYQVDRMNNAGTVVQSNIIARVQVGIELTTTIALRSDTRAQTATTFAAGERIRLLLSLINVGTMNAGTVNLQYGTGLSTSTGYLQFVENILTDDPVEVQQFYRSSQGGYYG